MMPVVVGEALLAPTRGVVLDPSSPFGLALAAGVAFVAGFWLAARRASEA